MDIMIDIETLGTRPGSVITSIGAVGFCTLRSAILCEFYQTVDVVDAQKHGLAVDAATVKWWQTQSPAAFEDAMSGVTPLRTVLAGLRAFVDGVAAEQDNAPRIWANSPNFDISLLEAAYDAVGDRDYPWAYRDTRDVRTLLDLTDLNMKMPAFWRAIGPKHNALADAKAQARAVIVANQRIQAGRAL